LKDLEIDKNNANKALNDKKSEFAQKNEEKNALILQTKDEEKIAKQINLLLKNMSFSSFSLEFVNDTDENKGQYQIRGHNGNIRPITKLSKGEKNIIAFLYFLFSLGKVSDDDKPKIIVLDDPMTSNDDTMQYLMIGEIQKFYTTKLSDNDFFILLTRNCHFYLNVKIPTPKNHGNFHLYSDGKHTTIKPVDKDDFRTNYGMLWKELIFLYEQGKPDLMLNSCRKICETYVNFANKEC
jgi:wobble nucleotide-excising tRNase